MTTTRKKICFAFMKKSHLGVCFIRVQFVPCEFDNKSLDFIFDW